MLALFANNIQTTLASNITSGQTSISLASATGLPAPTSGQYFVMTFTSGSTNEIVWVTNVSGTTITCIRGQEGTAAQSFVAGSFASCFPTAGTMRTLVQADQLQQNYYTYTDAGGTANALTGAIPSDLTALSDGMMVIVNAAYANTGAATFNLTLGSTVTGALPIVFGGNVAITAGVIPAAGTQILLIYSDSYNAWVLANPTIILTSYAPLASPTFTGVPLAPTATTGTNTTQIATTAFVQNTVANYAPLYNAALTGTPTVPTATAGTSTTQIASTAFVAASFAPLNSPAFTNTPTAPTATIGTNTAQLATTAFIQAAVGALFTSVHVVTGSRASGIGYTNSTGKPMQVCIYTSGANFETIVFYIDGTQVCNINSGSSGGAANLVAIVPSGGTYSAVLSSLAQWVEIY
jgi:hypothetical protein